MIRIAAALVAVAAQAPVQQAPLTFDFGKTLQLASGQWSYVPAAAGGEARFGTQLVLRCDKPARTMVLSRPGAAASTLTIVTDTQSRALPPNGRISAYDPLLDAMAFSRGRFLVAGNASGVLAVPSWPEAARAIEDCRN